MLKKLSDGLILRAATVEDSGRVSEFMAEIFNDAEARLRTLSFMSDRHPGVGASDFTVVEDTSTGAVVSTLCLMSRRWRYGKVPLNVDEVATVGTHADYRGRGLVRAQFAVVHRWSAERGSLVQGLLGIPWFYRQFGYEPALEDPARRVGRAADVPDLRGEAAGKWRVRLADEEDVAFIIETQTRASARHLISAVPDADRLRYAVSLRVRTMRVLAIVESGVGERVGYLSHRNCLQGGALELTACELTPETSWESVTPAVLRYLRSKGEEYSAQGDGGFAEIDLLLGSEHPMYQATSWPTRTPRPHAWYIRVANVVAFIRKIAPALERRLGGSVLSDYSGSIKISFGDTGMRMVLADGLIDTVEPWGPTKENKWAHQRQFDAIFPGLIFLQLIFGFRSTDDLEYAFADCRAGVDETRMLLDRMFPKGPSNTWAPEYPW